MPHCVCTSTHFRSQEDTQPSAQDPSLLQVFIEGNSDKVVSLENGLKTTKEFTLFDQKHTSTIPPHFITINALQPGTVTLRLHSYVRTKNGRQVNSSKNIPLVGVTLTETKCSFKVVVLPELYPVQSVELQELILRGQPVASLENFDFSSSSIFCGAFRKSALAIT